MPDDFVIERWSDPPPVETLRDLTGRVLSVWVAPQWGPDPIPFAEFFRFARVLGVELGAQFICSRCDTAAVSRITVEWESGYESPDGTVICELCVDGDLTSGGELIAFGAEPTGGVGIASISAWTDLRPRRRDG